MPRSLSEEPKIGNRDLPQRGLHFLINTHRQGMHTGDMTSLRWMRTQIGAEIAIDVCCATIAEVRKRGEKFWGEFEFYLSDLAVGMVLDIVLVTLLAPVAVVGKYPKAVKSTGECGNHICHLLGSGSLIVA